MSEESLPLMLKSLRLPTFAQHHQSFQETATENAWSYSQYLAALCEQEMATRFQSRVNNWTRDAKLPKAKSFATFTLNEMPQDVQKKMISLRDNTQWALQADNVLLIGPSGVGKSHMAAALGLHLIEQGIRVTWISGRNCVGSTSSASKKRSGTYECYVSIG